MAREILNMNRPKEDQWSLYDEPLGRIEMKDGRKGTVVGVGYVPGECKVIFRQDLMWVVELDGGDGYVWVKKT